MSKLEKLYNSIANLKELGIKLPKELLEETDRVEEEIIKNEVIPALSDAIEPIITQIQRELVLVVDYIPNEPLQVRMSRKRNFKMGEEDRAEPLKRKEFKKEQTYTIAPHTKSKKTNLEVVMPDGSVISNRFAYQTFCEVIERLGPEKVAALGLRQSGIDLVSKVEDDFYQQHRIRGGYLVLTHSSTEQKKKHLDEISTLLNIKCSVAIK